ncbi:MAG TPA: triose-phosphate isomerase [Nitrospiraceae bacterium]|nr:MAG: triose-phosphate isomerase [Nitrospirae bacterium GWA2_46_11]OGW24429.1 MAG: triose-phosphate isomerase [Nitrospirae bacterium GWB2_47_37]HAK89492.1 triose-phosphate isomerase [Nitrospiraceae bacterium]HCZ12888.1 triose-phosphate isomerase [Nitrospiraceae bacterium]
MRTPFIAANWKMNKTIGETESFLKAFIPLVQDAKAVEIIIAPPFTSLNIASSMIKDTNIQLSAQDIFYEEKGAFTGEVSPVMLADAGCEHVIIGHSERRQYFHETDEIVNEKIKAARKQGLDVIFCIGESLEERESGKTFDVLKRETENGLKDVSADGIVVAYEPIWAIGTGKTATIEQAQEAHKYIRERLASIYGNKANEIRILYGGSVTPDNVDSLMACEDVDGALVGGASLKPDSFARIVKFKK